jgi:hypothetical protein
MRTSVMAIASLLLLAAPPHAAHAARPHSEFPGPNAQAAALATASATTLPTALPRAGADAKAGASSLAGTWKSAADRLGLTTEFDVSVWGPNASSERVVELTLDQAGKGTLVVTRRVVDGKGRTVKASTSVERADIVVGGVQTPPIPNPARTEHAVTVSKAERRYPDDPTYMWPLDGLAVKIATFPDGDRNVLEVRVDTPEGRGSFWETLRRLGPTASSRVSQRSSGRQATPRP